MTILKHIATVFFIAFLAIICNANPIFDQGLKAANEKKYAEAIKSFEKVIEAEPANVSAYFNLGNCFFESKRYGKAIWAYERVLKYAPRDSEASMNIELAYKKLATDKQWESHTSGLQRLIFSIGANTWSILAICLSVLMSFSIFYLFRSKNSPWKRMHFMLLFGETVFLIGFIIAAKSTADYLEKEQFALVTKTSIPTYMDDRGDKSELQLTEGTKVEILNPTKTKLEVRLNDGKTVLINPQDIDKI